MSDYGPMACKAMLESVDEGTQPLCGKGAMGVINAFRGSSAPTPQAQKSAPTLQAHSPSPFIP